MRVNKFGSGSTRNIISSVLPWRKCVFLVCFEFSLACNPVDYQPDHVFCCCAILRDKAKDSVAVGVGGMEWEIQREMI